jgi:XTP/dITP diphosphohydrolase
MDGVRASLASGNAHKLVELAAALPAWELSLLEGVEFPPENGSTYEENARAKAAFARRLPTVEGWVLGEDSGIEVAALGGGPGIHSARYEGWQDRLLRELEGVEDREARYVCAIVALSPEGEEVVVRGTLEGRVAHEARGSEGFGYDPIFIPGGETRTVAELGNAWKREHSHRARAAKALLAAVSARSDGERALDVNPIEVQKALEGASYPSDRDTLVSTAERNGAGGDVLEQLRALPEQEYSGLDDVMEALGRS